jgi:hypothetical protein
MSPCSVAICFACCCLQTLPNSLHVLNVTSVPVKAFSQLTALRDLDVSYTVDESSDPSCLSMLGQLTSLRLRWAQLTSWSTFEGCTGLRALHLGGAFCLLHAA